MPNMFDPSLAGSNDSQGASSQGPTSGGNMFDPSLPGSDNSQQSVQTNPQSTQTDPGDIATAEGQKGRQDLNGWCEKAVEQWAGLPQMGNTAADAWNNWVTQKKAYQGLQGAKPGDLLYFGPNGSNSDEGHAALLKGYDSKGNPIMVSATDNGVQENDVNQWSQSVAPLLGYVRP